jgi:hypothetical protein
MEIFRKYLINDVDTSELSLFAGVSLAAILYMFGKFSTSYDKNQFPTFSNYSEDCA